MTMSNTRGFLLTAIAVSLAQLVAVDVLAQPKENVQRARTGVLEEIVVTSRKRGDEVLQDVPATITAFGTETLQNMRVLNFDQFAYQVPGLTFNDEGAGQKRYVLRGIQSAGQQQVAVYYDEVPIPGVQGASGDSGSQTTDLKLFDMERIEVLKGPQGTTFGANSQAGTIRFLTQKPDLEELAGKVKAGGNTVTEGGNGGSVYGMINIPLSATLGFRGVAYYDREAGYVDNVRLDRDDVNWAKTKGGRFALRWEPTDRMTLDAMAWLQDRDTGGPARFNPYDSFSDSPDNTDFVDNNLQPLQDIRAIAQFDTGDLNVGDYTRGDMPDDQRIYSLTLNWDMDWATLVATGAWFERDFGFKRDSSWVLLRLGVVPEQFPGDPDANRPDLFPALTDQTQSVEQESFEMRLNSTASGNLQWMGGLFYRKRDSDFRSYVPVVNESGVPFDPGYPPTGYVSGAPGEGINGCHPCVFARKNTRTIEEKAVFGEISYLVAEQFEFMFGARWFEAEQDDSGIQEFPFALFPPENFLPDADTRYFKEDNVITKYHLSWVPRDGLVFDALASQGFRLGGTNQQGVVAVPAGYTSDELWNYELGAKTSWLDNRYHLNVALFQIDWEDIQVSGRDPTGAFAFIGNAGAAEVRGLEVELVGRPSANLDVTAGVSWLETHELSEDQITDEVVAPGREGDELPFTPELTANATAQYSYDLPYGGWHGFVRGEYAYKSSTNSELDTSSRFNRKMDSYQIVNLRTGFSNAQGDLDISVYAENVFDERGDVRVRTEDSLLTFKWTNPPRTIGIDITKRF